MEYQRAEEGTFVQMCFPIIHNGGKIDSISKNLLLHFLHSSNGFSYLLDGIPF